jgi:uncharacterized LabA/DUF88 family protein
MARCACLRGSKFGRSARPLEGTVADRTVHGLRLLGRPRAGRSVNLVHCHRNPAHEESMANEPRAPRLAVLIDADNASARIASGLFEEIAKIGEASVRRIYGDFSGSRLKTWSEVLSTHAIMPHQNFAYTSGKNASDIALVIDAMDLLHSGRFDGFCLVSSDSDFTRLAARIREQGVDVYGFGEQKTPESFRQACRRFIYTENLLPEAPAPHEPERPDARPASATRPINEAVPLIRTAISQLDDEDGWVSLGGVGQRLAILASDFDPRTFGFAKLSSLVAKTRAFEMRHAEGRHMQIRAKATSRVAAPEPKQRRSRSSRAATAPSAAE